MSSAEVSGERRQLADDLYQICRSIPAAFPVLTQLQPDIRNPELFLRQMQHPVFIAQSDLETACESRNAEALAGAAERARRSERRKK